MSEYCEEYVDVAVETTLKARKDHVCDACKRVVRKGEMYVRDSTLFDGAWTVVKRCGACEATYQHLRTKCSDSFDMCPRPDLGCGLRYESEWGPLPDEIAALAFLTNSEASALLEPKP